METALLIVWSIALLIIAALLVALSTVFKQRIRYDTVVVPVGAATIGGTRTARPPVDTIEKPTQSAPWQAKKEVLQFKYDQEAPQKTADGRLVIKVPGIAWDSSWQRDTVNIQVNSRPPKEIVLLDADAFAAYNLVARRETSQGKDIPVYGFAAPIEIIFSAEPNELWAVYAYRGGYWIPIPHAHVSSTASGIRIFLSQLAPLCWAKRNMD